MARCLVGLPHLRGKLSNYVNRFDMLEVVPLDSPVPRGKKLAAWRQSVPPAFVFNVVLPQAVATFANGSDYDEAIKVSLETATTLQARCLVLITPPTVRPTKTNRERILKLAKRLAREGQILAWEARGMWETEDVLATAQAANMLAIFDATQEPLPPGPIAYTRIKAIGQNYTLGAGNIERIAEELHERREAYVVVDGTAAPKVKAGLAAALERQHQDRTTVPAMFRPGQLLIADDEEQ